MSGARGSSNRCEAVGSNRAWTQEEKRPHREGAERHEDAFRTELKRAAKAARSSDANEHAQVQLFGLCTAARFVAHAQVTASAVRVGVNWTVLPRTSALATPVMDAGRTPFAPFVATVEYLPTAPNEVLIFELELLDVKK